MNSGEFVTGAFRIKSEAGERFVVMGEARGCALGIKVDGD